jgi:hypothetical protein
MEKSFSLREDGDANVYHIMKDKNWFARVLLNGEMMDAEQKRHMQNIIDALNNSEVRKVAEDRHNELFNGTKHTLNLDDPWGGV